MAVQDTVYSIGARLFMVGFGAVGAFCLWALADGWGTGFIGGRAFLALMSFAAAFVAVALALMGPLPPARSMAGAAALALPLAAMVTWAGLRFDDPNRFLNDGAALAVAGVIVVMATPFLLVFLSDRARWLDYPTLFDTAWTIAVRYMAGWVFAGVFWVVVFLSNALLELVEVDVINLLFDIDWLRFALSGAMFGLGLAVAYELRDFVSPRLPLRLLRLLLPILLAVVTVFLTVLPFRGLSDLFGDFSSAGTLMGVAIASISLISIALDRDEYEGVSTRGIRAAVRVLALMVPVLGALALWAVVLRVLQYAWTPERVLAAMIATLLLGYGVTYASAALRGRGWRHRIRQGNIGMALGTLVLAVIWLTPLLHPQRISATSQLNRFDSGDATPDELPLWELKTEWGVAGQAVLQDLSDRAAAQDQPRLAERLAALEAAPTRYDFDRDLDRVAARTGVAELIPLMPVRPENARVLTPELFEDLPGYRIGQWRDGCALGTPQAPACVWVSGAFLPGYPAQDQALILFRTEAGVTASHVTIRDGRIDTRVREVFDVLTGNWGATPDQAIADILSGDFAVTPSGLSGLELGGVRLVPGN